MKSALFAAAALFAASAGEARMTGPVPRAVEPVSRHGAPGVPGNCAIRIVFGSFGPGIDGSTLTRMVRRLRTDRRVRNFSRHPWGREGEVTLCVHLVRLRDAYRIGRELNAMVPARPRGPVQVQFPGRMPPPD